MRQVLFVLLALVLLATAVWGMEPKVGEDRWETPVGAMDKAEEDSSAAPQNDRTGGYTDAEINEIANVVNGEVGGIGGASVVLTFADGTQRLTNGYELRMIHACVVDNQVRSGLFPSTVDGCVRQCWSTAYASTGWRDSAQWQGCRQAVVDALSGGASVPSNVYAATCDNGFASYYAGWKLWARVDWNTGWVSGTFYYYCYG